jgi:hypothetical protein
MPWTPNQAQEHNRGADTKKKKKVWSEVANKILRETGDEGRAVRIANHAVSNVGKSIALLRIILKKMPGAAGVVDKKISKEEANYHDKSIDLMKCKGCMMFNQPDGCDLVVGKISPEGWCEHYLSDSQSHTGFSFGAPS